MREAGIGAAPEDGNAERPSARESGRSPVVTLEDDGATDPRSGRQRDILKLLQQTSQVRGTELAQRFGVSGMTIRRDLAELAEAGQLRRVHGGAVIRHAPAYGSRASTHAPEKAAIARAVAQLAKPGAAVGLDSGTTCHAVAAELAYRSDLTIVTNALQEAITVGKGGSRVIVLGGLLTPQLTLVNPGTAHEPPPVHLDLLILGCGGLSVDPGITYFDPTEVEVRRMLVGLADRIVLAADSSKFDLKKAMVLGPLEIIDDLVTDRTPPKHLHTALLKAGVDVVVAS